jgi:hypothetical protein
MLSKIRRIESIIGRAEVAPRLGHRILPSNIARVLGEHNCEPELQMPVDVTDSLFQCCTLTFMKDDLPVQEPWARVVGGEANGDVITGSADVDDIATRRVGVVVC